jgi:hypothetical protein
MLLAMEEYDPDTVGEAETREASGGREEGGETESPRVSPI